METLGTGGKGPVSSTCMRLRGVWRLYDFLGAWVEGLGLVALAGLTSLDTLDTLGEAGGR